MSASLVGSEMCIRDRGSCDGTCWRVRCRTGLPSPSSERSASGEAAGVDWEGAGAGVASEE
eukprot:13225898-Alexandrium_andersonii.AAC.1